MAARRARTGADRADGREPAASLGLQAVVVESDLAVMEALVDDAGRLHALRLREPGASPGPSPGTTAPRGPGAARVREQLTAYAAGSLTEFDLPLGTPARATEFRRRVWAALLDIPFGETRSYREIAAAIGAPAAVRAVGGANHANPIGLVVPCHRVIGATGALVGYGGGLPMKERLLNHERAVAARLGLKVREPARQTGLQLAPTNPRPRHAALATA